MDTDGRGRFIYMDWPRSIDAGRLPRPALSGIRPPNRLIWADSVEGFFMVHHLPSLPGWVTAWSISMLRELNEANLEENIELLGLGPQVDPYIYLPFPLLRRPFTSNNVEKPLWSSIQGGIDRGAVISQIPGFDPGSTVKFGQVYERNLEEFIPASYFPDILIVNDPKSITEGKRVEVGCNDIEATPRKYKRVWPVMDPSVVPNAESRQNVAYLNLAGAPLLGKGHHSVVHRAALKLPLDLDAYTGDGSVGVAAKIAFPTVGARRFLDHEAKMYSTIYGEAVESGMDFHDKDGNPLGISYGNGDRRSSRHLMEDWSGLCLLTPHIPYPVPVKAVVPKFFGYYIPADEAEEFAKKRRAADGGKFNKADFWGNSEDGAEDRKASDTLLSPILLLEDCGKPIDPKSMDMDDRTECLSFLERLWYAEHMIHHSFYPRNILVQPGPLHFPPCDRSMVHPSYRLIDLGRVETWPMREAKEKAKYKEKEGKELEYVELPLDAEGYLDWYMPQEGLKKVWYSIKSDWSQDHFAELTEAKKLLLISNTPEAYFHGMYIAVREKSAFSRVPERKEKGKDKETT